MNKWGKQNTICIRCKNPAVQTFETVNDGEYGENRYFERLCASCLYWSAWIWIGRGAEIKVTIDACE